MTRRRSRVRLADVVRTLPHRSHGVPKQTVRDSQRWRLLEGMVEATARSGYADATVADVIAFAGVSRKAFYEHFTDKEDCFLATYDVVSDRLIAQLVAAGSGHPSRLARRRAYVLGYLAVLDRDPAVARVFTVDVLGAGRRVLERRDAVNRRFADELFGDSRLGVVRRVAVVGGVNAVVASELLNPKPQLLALGESLTAYVQAALRS